MSLQCDYPTFRRGDHASHHLGDVPHLEARIPRVDALRGEGEEEVLAHPAPLPWNIGRRSSSVVSG